MSGRWFIPIVVATWAGLAGCGDDGTPTTPRPGSNPQPPRDGGIQVEMGPWEDACIAWSRADCDKFESCFGRRGAGCDATDDGLRADCREQAADDGCDRPSGASFERCVTRVEEQTCEEYCDTEFCFSFCFYTCF